MALTVVGSTRVLTPAAGATANVGNVATQTNTFHVLNASSNVSPAYCYVGVFPTYAQAIAMDHPTVGTDAGGLPLAPGESMTLIGNFGTQLLAGQANVYVSAITAAGSTSVFFTPVAPGSD
jgi:hypothetical protein